MPQEISVDDFYSRAQQGSSAPSTPGLLEPGNIDLDHRPIVRNGDGSISTVRSMGVNVDGKEVLIPTVAADGSRILSNKEAVDQYRRTGKHLGVFDTPKNSSAYAEKLHEAQAKKYPNDSPRQVPVDDFFAAVHKPAESTAGAGRGGQGGPAAGDEAAYRRRKIGVGVARGVAEAGDALWSTLYSLPGDAAGIGAFDKALYTGKGRTAAGQAGVDTQKAVTATAEKFLDKYHLAHPLEDALSKFTKEGDPVTPSIVSKAMGWMSEKIKSGSEYAEAKTGGVLRAHELELAASTLMDYYGAKGLVKIGGKLVPKRGKAAAPAEAGDSQPFEARQDPTLDPQGPHEAREMPPAPPPEGGMPPAPRPEGGMPPAPPPEEVVPPAPKPLGPIPPAPRPEDGSLPRNPFVKPNQSSPGGSATTVAMAIAAATTGGIALANKYPDDAHKILGSAMGLDMLVGSVRGIGDYNHLIDNKASEHYSLGTLLGQGENTLSTLELLPQNKTRITHEQVEQLLKRQDVSKSEKELFTKALSLIKNVSDGEKDFSSGLLVGTLNMLTDNFVLHPMETSSHATFGVQNIDRQNRASTAYTIAEAEIGVQEARDQVEYEETHGTPDPEMRAYFRRRLQAAEANLAKVREEQAKGAKNFKTVIWQAPHATKPDNHFSDPNYFSHHREFEEDEIPHVIETQSDLVANHPAPTPEKVTKYAELDREKGELDREKHQLAIDLRDQKVHPDNLYGDGRLNYLSKHGLPVASKEVAAQHLRDGDLVFHWDNEVGAWAKVYGEASLATMEFAPGRMLWTPEPRPKNTGYKNVPYQREARDKYVEAKGKPVNSAEELEDAISAGDHVFKPNEKGGYEQIYAKRQFPEDLSTARVVEGPLKRGDFVTNSQRYRMQARARDIQTRIYEVEREQRVLKVAGNEHLGKLQPMYNNWDRRTYREVLAMKAREGKPVVRFATAETAAKVEAWPMEDVDDDAAEHLRMDLDSIHHRIDAYERFLRTGDSQGDLYLEGQTPAQVQRMIEESRAEKTRIEEYIRDQGEVGAPARMKSHVEDRLNRDFPDWTGTGVDNEKKAAARTVYMGAMQKAWDRGFRLTSPGHATIFARYLEGEKFFKNLGGKPHTDAHGHTWWEVPTSGRNTSPSALASGKRAQMFGGATFDQMKNLAVLTLGVAGGAYLDPENPIVGAVIGGLAAVSTMKGSLAGARNAFGNLLKADTRIRINNITQDYAHHLAAAERSAFQVGAQIIKLVPKRERRQAIHQAIDEGRINQLTGKERQAADFARQFYEDVARKAQAAGVLDHALVDYSTHLWDRRSRGAFERLLEQLNPTAGMGTRSRFNLKRRFPTLAQGKAAGLTPMTEDLAEVLGIYGNSMARTLANKQLLERLKSAVGPQGQRLVVPATSSHPGYVTINNPVLQTLRVHADIAPSLKFLYEAQDPGAAMSAISAINTALKRNAVTFSLFHASALAQAALGARKILTSPLITTKVIAQTAFPRVFGENKYLKMLREGGAGDLVDAALKGGVRISFERGESTVGDVGGGFYEGMKLIQNYMDEKLPGNVGSKTVGTYSRVNHAFDNWMWGRLHAAFKLETFAAKREILLENNAKAGTPMSEAKAGEIAARYTNDVFGGLNWQRLAENAKTRWGRDISLAMNSPAGRRTSQLLLFAPDWTLSTSRAFTKLFGKGSGIKGLLRPTAEADLYRQQLVRSGIYYFTVANALNYYFTGHSVFENDPNIGWLYVDFGDGRKMQISKHFTEPLHWLTDPRQEALNKLGVVPKEIAAQLLSKEYLSTKGMPPMDTSPAGRLKHAAKNLLPIGANQMVQSSEAGISGTLGFPIYGKTKEQARAAEKERRQKEHQASIDRYRKAHGITQ